MKGILMKNSLTVFNEKHGIKFLLHFITAKFSNCLGFHDDLLFGWIRVPSLNLDFAKGENKKRNSYQGYYRTRDFGSRDGKKSRDFYLRF